MSDANVTVYTTVIHYNNQFNKNFILILIVRRDPLTINKIKRTLTSINPNKIDRGLGGSVGSSNKIYHQKILPPNDITLIKIYTLKRFYSIVIVQMTLSPNNFNPNTIYSEMTLTQYNLYQNDLITPHLT